MNWIPSRTSSKTRSTIEAYFVIWKPKITPNPFLVIARPVKPAYAEFKWHPGLVATGDIVSPSGSPVTEAIPFVDVEVAFGSGLGIESVVK